ncbi:MAG: ABC transporter ATP-binding protein [Bacillota bacterium]|nr:ABC transporter ATP-binding protein [Bacillota bacterium]
MLELIKISAGYKGIQILWDINLQVKQGEVVALIGANGAGKSTILKTITGSIKPFTGQIIFKDENIEGLDANKVVKKGLVYIPEGRRVFPYLSVKENLELGGYIIDKKTDLLEQLSNTYRLFPRLNERQKQLAGTLSGGEQQMLVIGRALMSKPDLLMIDEPSLGLQPTIVSDVYDVISKLNEQGITILLVEQSISRSIEIAHRAYVLENGKIVISGSCKSLADNKMVKEAYLGM